MGQTLDVKFKGLFTNPNPLSEIPKGALEIANNVVIDRPSIAESRRGQNYYGDQLLSTSDLVKKIFNYKNGLISQNGSYLNYDSDNAGTWTRYTGTYDAPSSLIKMKEVESNGNFYFTTDEGIKKLDGLTSTPIATGAPKALGGTASLSGSSGFMTDGTQIAYRILWGYEDANGNLILGAPSQRILVANSAGGTRDVSLTFQIPDGIDETWLYQIYRSGESSSAATEPNDEMQLVVEDNPSTAQITAEEITLIDARPNNLKGAILYTSPSQQGIAKANDVPPLANDIAVFREHTFYANTTTKNRLFLNLIAVGGNAFKYVSETGDTADTSDSITNIGDTSTLRVGMRVVGTGVPTDATIVSIDSGTAITISADATVTDTTVSLEFQDRITINGVDYWGGSTKTTNQFVVDTGATPAEDIDITSKNFVEVFNTSASNTTLYAYYLSGFDELPGQILIEERALGGATFDATSTYGNSFEPILPTSGSTVTSDNERKKNRVYYAKPKQPEAVPILQYFDIGSADKHVIRIINLAEALFVLKQDGVWRITGFDASDFTVYELDTTISINFGETFVALNKKIYGVSDQGVVAINDSGVEIVSLPIEKTLLQLASFSNFNAVSFGVGYESDRKYILFCPLTESDTYAQQAYVFNFYTESWTRWPMARSCGLVSKRDNKLYMGNPVNNFIYQERKNFNVSDYADESFATSIASYDGLEITLDDATGVEVGMSVSQGAKRSLITAIDGDVLTVVNLFAWDTGEDLDINKPFKVEVKTRAIDAENPGLLKQFTNVDALFLDASFNEAIIGFESNFSPYIEETTLESLGIGAWGALPWGSFVWGGQDGGETSIPTLVPREKSHAHWLKANVHLTQCFKNFQMTGYSIRVEGNELGGYRR